jgi:hypothetical protein
MLYTTLSAVLKIPYKPLTQPGQMPFPLQRLFLEMTVRISRTQTDIMKRLLFIYLLSPKVDSSCYTLTSDGN